MCAIWTNTFCNFDKYIGQFGQQNCSDCLSFANSISISVCLELKKEKWLHHISFWKWYKVHTKFVVSYSKQKFGIVKKKTIVFQTMVLYSVWRVKVKKHFPLVIWPAAPGRERYRHHLRQFLSPSIWFCICFINLFFISAQLIDYRIPSWEKNPYKVVAAGRFSKGEMRTMISSSQLLDCPRPQVDRASIFNASSCPPVSASPDLRG